MHRLIHSVLIHVPAPRVDLRYWLETISLTDYQSFSNNHIQSLCNVDRNGHIMQINEEDYGPLTIRHYYQHKYASSGETDLFSKKSICSLFGIPFHFSCRWTMKLDPVNDYTSKLICIYEYGFSRLINILFKIILFPFPAFGSRRQIKNECILYAQDIVKKFA